MNIIRKLARGISSSVLKSSLFGLAVAAALISVFGAPGAIKQNLEQSGVYNHVVDAIAKSMRQEDQSGRESDSQIPLDNPELVQVAKTAFTPQVFQSASESTIDGFYGWLDGKTPRPEFTVDFTEPKARFIEDVADYAGNRLEGLPPCSLQQSLELSRQGPINPFTVTCRPPIDIAAEKQRLVAQLSSEEGFLGEPVITAESLSENNQQSIDFQDSSAPQIFQLLKRLPLILALVSILAAAGVLLLADDKRRGLWSISITLFGTGLFLIISTLILSYLFNNANRPDSGLDRAVNLADHDLRMAFIDVVRSLFAALSRQLQLIAGSYAITGGVTLLILHRTRPKPAESIAESEEPLQEATDNENNQQSPKHQK